MSKRVLVIDDSPMMRQLLGFALRRIPGLDISEVEDGARALELMDTEQFDLILLDINMPVMGGFSFLERLAERGGELPRIIVVTTDGQNEDVERAYALGATAFVTKPVQAPKLAATVKKVLAGIG